MRLLHQYSLWTYYHGQTLRWDVMFMRFLFYNLLICGLVGCGFKGPLYLPPDESQHSTSSIVGGGKGISGKNTILDKDVKVGTKSVASVAVN